MSKINFRIIVEHGDMYQDEQGKLWVNVVGADLESLETSIAAYKAAEETAV